MKLNQCGWLIHPRVSYLGLYSLILAQWSLWQVDWWWSLPFFACFGFSQGRARDWHVERDARDADMALDAEMGRHMAEYYRDRMEGGNDR